MKPRILDLFSGAGGAAMGLHQAGFEVVGVDIKPQPHYPFEFHQADALTYPLEGFDAIWASPPCQAFSMMQNIHKNQAKHPKLIESMRERLKATDKPFILENVPGAPLHVTAMLCGTMFELPIIRHRVFETTFPMPLLMPCCNHEKVYDPWHGGEPARGERHKLARAMGIDWQVSRCELRQAIPPAYSRFIGEQLRNVL
jgi:hypothetical protein